MKRLGIYIHIPFCASKCGYCDFYSLAGCEQKMPDYQSALLSHISESADAMSTFQIDSVYFGGGTPSYFGAKRIAELLDELKLGGRLRLDAEITVEANPDSMKLEDLKLLRQEGVNRLSIGVQSANNDLLKIIGRRHNFRQAVAAVDTARRAGFENLSLDLIYGLPSQTRGDWADSLSKVLELHPEHLSCYGLKLEENTPMYRYNGSPLIPDDDQQADMYLYTVEALEHYGYPQYEISNFAVPGFESRHNLKYWQLGDYMGFGPGAHSCVDNVRYSYVKDLDRYIEAVVGDGNIIDEYESSIPVQRAAEYIMLGMRTVHGISEKEYHNIYLGDWTPLDETFRGFEEKGWAKKTEDRWSLTPSGFLLSNQLIGAMLDAQTGAKVLGTPWMKSAYDAQEKQTLPEGDIERFEAFYRDRANVRDKENSRYAGTEGQAQRSKD